VKVLNENPAFRSATDFPGQLCPLPPSQQSRAAYGEHGVGPTLLGLVRIIDQRLIPAARSVAVDLEA